MIKNIISNNYMYWLGDYYLTDLLFSYSKLQWWFIGSYSSELGNISGKSLCINYQFDHCGILDISDDFSSFQFLEHFFLLLYVLSVISFLESYSLISTFCHFGSLLCSLISLELRSIDPTSFLHSLTSVLFQVKGHGQLW